MRKTFILIFALFSTLLSAQNNQLFELLTRHDGYWMLYCERTEQYANGEYLALDKYFYDNSNMVIEFEANGTYNYVAYDDAPQVYSCKWRLNNNQLILSGIDEDFIQVLNIVEISDSTLVVRYFERLPNRDVAKIYTYCFPDKRLSAEEVETLNAKGVKEIQGFSKFEQ